MAKYKDPRQNYLKTRKEEEARRGDIKFNLVYGMAEKLGKEEYIENKYKEANEKYGIEFLNQGESLGQPEQNDLGGDERDSGYFGAEKRPAPTTNAKRPRALNLAYIRDSQTLLVQFRDERWVEYDADIPAEMWQDLKATDSTGKYLKYSGIDEMPWHYFSPNHLPKEVQVLFE